jgi:HlyD family secretion protein
MTTSIHPDAPPDRISTVPAAVRAAVAAHGDDAPPVEPPASARSLQALADAPPITPRRHRPSRKARWLRRLVLLAIFASIGFAATVYRAPLMDKFRSLAGSRITTGLENIQTYSARRGELRITLVEEGKLRAVNNYTIRMGTSGKITWLAEAGAKVKKGDRLATIDTKQYEDQIRTVESDLENQIKQLEIAEKALPIAKSNGAAAIGTAETSLANAKLALKQYKTLDAPKKLNDLENAVNDARSKLSDLQKKRQDIQTQLDELMDESAKKTKEADLVLAKQSESSQRRTVNTSEDQRKLYRSYTYTQDLATKERAVKNAELDVEKAKVNAENEYLAKQAEVNRIKTSITRVQNNIKQYKNYIDNATATAPADGLVFYGGPDLDRYGMSVDSIKVGADWYSSYPIMSIPDLSSFLVNFPVAEVYRGRVSTGMPATITIDAIPGLVLNGKLTTLSSVSRNKVQYDSSSPPVYDATLSLETIDPRMVAGMTVQVEIVTASLKDVLFVPVEAVFNEEGKTAVFLWVEDPAAPQKGRIEKRPVLTGQASDHFVQMLGGVAEGDKLLLSRPAAFVTPANFREMADALPALAPASGPGTLKSEFTPATGSAADRGLIRANPDGSVTLVPATSATVAPTTTSTPTASSSPAAATAPAATTVPRTPSSAPTPLGTVPSTPTTNR